MMATESALKQMAADENITVAIEGQRTRLRNFIRKWVPDEGTVEDILQDVFYEFVQAYRLTEIEQVGAWLFRVAKNRITDFFRTRKSARFEELKPEDVPSSQAAGPEDAYLQSLFWQALDTALAELPEEQREVFIAHEFEGRSFKNSLRRLHRSAEAPSRRSLGALDGGAVGRDDAGGTREIARAHVPRLRPIWTATGTEILTIYEVGKSSVADLYPRKAN